MAIVATEVESVHGDVSGQRLVFYRCRDDQGVWHSYGPVITSDPTYDPSTQLAVIADRVAQNLADAEFEEVVG